MKRFFFAIAALLATVSMQAQHEEGTTSVQPRAGINFSTMNDFNKAKVGYNFGVEIEHQMSEAFSLSAGLMYSDQGAADNTDGDKMLLDVDFVNVPVLLNWYVAPEVIPGLALKTGAQVGFRAKTSARYKGAKIDLDQLLKMLGEDNYLRKVMFSIPVGISYEYSNLVLNARYIIGVTPLVKGELSSRNNVLQFSLGYRFDAAF